jgi:hypothetical protein
VIRLWLGVLKHHVVHHPPKAICVRILPHHATLQEIVSGSVWTVYRVRGREREREREKPPKEEEECRSPTLIAVASEFQYTAKFFSVTSL